MTSKKKDKSHTVRGRSAARLAAVQALYQLEQEPVAITAVVMEFINHRFGQTVDDITYTNADITLFRELVTGVQDNKDSLDNAIEPTLSDGWRMERLESVVRSILRSAAFEIIHCPLVPKAVIINEYVDLTKAFYDGRESAFVNASLDALAQKARPNE